MSWMTNAPTVTAQANAAAPTTCPAVKARRVRRCSSARVAASSGASAASDVIDAPQRAVTETWFVSRAAAQEREPEHGPLVRTQVDHPIGDHHVGPAVLR